MCDTVAIEVIIAGVIAETFPAFAKPRNAHKAFGTAIFGVATVAVVFADAISRAG